MFQYLTGSIHTPFPLQTTKQGLVSIPHRFNSHPGYVVWLIVTLLSFQSLTGSIHTFTRFFYSATYQSGFNPSQVQFTQKYLTTEQVEELLFQSLTGSIHTQLKDFPNFTKDIVSIPHRFNSHTFLTIVALRHSSSFNPSQVQFTQTREKARGNPKGVSIPHRFNSHFLNFNNFFGLKKCFNPSQVQFTLCVYFLANDFSLMFQSLTGSIHTGRE